MNDIIRIDDNCPKFSTMVAETKSEKAKFFNATQNPADKLSAYINQKLTIKDIYMEKTQRIDEETGEITDCIKTVLIDDKGVGHLAHSSGIAKSLMSIIEIFGMPDEWDEPMVVEVKQVETPKGRYFKLEVV